MYEHICSSNEKENIWQSWTIYKNNFSINPEITLNSQERQTLKSGKLSEKKYDTLHIKCSVLRKCEMCGFCSIKRRFRDNYLNHDFLKNNFYLHGFFCLKCNYQINALKDSINLIYDIKKELQNVRKANKSNANSRAITSIPMQHDVRD